MKTQYRQPTTEELIAACNKAAATYPDGCLEKDKILQYRDELAKGKK